MTVAVLGWGHVGKQVANLFESADIPVLIYDPPLGFKDREAINNECEVAFISVPTPSEPNSGFLDTFRVSESIDWLEVPLIIIRSTLNVGETEKWARIYGKALCYSPAWGPGETVGHLFANMKHDPFVIVAGEAEARREAIEWYKLCYPPTVRFIQMKSKEAEIVKLAENSFAGYKVSFFNDLARICDRHLADYNAVREALISDPRIGPYWTFDFGCWDSKCLAKDIPAFVANGDGEAVVVEAVLARNRELMEGMS